MKSRSIFCFRGGVLRRFGFVKLVCAILKRKEIIGEKCFMPVIFFVVLNLHEQIFLLKIWFLDKCVDAAGLTYCYPKAVKGACNDELGLMVVKCGRSCHLWCVYIFVMHFLQLFLSRYFYPHTSFNSFHAVGLFLYPLKTSENPWCFQGW